MSTKYVSAKEEMETAREALRQAKEMEARLLKKRKLKVVRISATTTVAATKERMKDVKRYHGIN